MQFEECECDDDYISNTYKTIKWGAKVFENYCSVHNVNIDLHRASEDEIAGVLKQFYTNACKRNGKPYSPNALAVIRSALLKTLVSPPFERPIDIVNDRAFNDANRVFKEKTESLKKLNRPSPQAKTQITEGDMQKLGKYFSDFSTDAWKLLHFVWFGLCYYFGSRGRYCWRSLNKNSFMLERDEEKDVFLTEKDFCNEKTVGAQSHQNCSRDMRVYDAKLISAFQLFMEKRSPDCDSLFVYPKQKWSKKVNFGDSYWFGTRVVGPHTILKFMPTMSKRAQLSQRYTQTCVRSSMMSILSKAGVSPKDIVKATKYQFENGLNAYMDGNNRSTDQGASVNAVQPQDVALSCEKNPQTPRSVRFHHTNYR